MLPSVVYLIVLFASELVNVMLCAVSYIPVIDEKLISLAKTSGAEFATLNKSFFEQLIKIKIELASK